MELQSLTVAPLALGDTIPPSLKDKAVLGLVEDIKSRDFHLTVGSVGAKHLLPQLAKADQNAAALKIATQTTYPSFGYWLGKGATTCFFSFLFWESWSGIPDPSHPPTPTHNHIFLCGGLGEWLYRSVGGIAPAAPGFTRATIFPDIDATSGLTATNASVLTPGGRISVALQLGTGAISRTVAISLPAGVDGATVKFRGPQDLYLAENGTTIWSGGTFFKGTPGVVGASWSADHGGMLEVEVLSGSYALVLA